MCLTGTLTDFVFPKSAKSKYNQPLYPKDLGHKDEKRWSYVTTIFRNFRVSGKHFFSSTSVIHPHTEVAFISPEIGYGVVAKTLIPKGTVTWVLDALDRSFTPEEVAQMDPLYQEILDTYSYRNHQGHYVLCWDHGRYVNHSFQANCLSTAYDFEIAIRDIQPGEQLTDDYGYLNVQRPFRGIDEGTRRKTVYPDDLLRYHRVWDKKVQQILPALLRVDQPLRPVFSAEKWSQVERLARRQEPMQSLLTCYCQPQQPAA